MTTFSKGAPLANGFWGNPGGGSYLTVTEVSYGPMQGLPEAHSVSSATSLTSGEIVGVVIGTVTGALILAAVSSALTALVIQKMRNAQGESVGSSQRSAVAV